jgi:hypothetical protein
MHTSFTHVAYYTQEKKISDLKRASSEEFDIDEGPFCRALDTALGTFKVYREAYFGGTFTGNHAHKCLQVRNRCSNML